MGRNIRQSKILDIISSKNICSQEELLNELSDLEFSVNQSTISRDIKELGLVKVKLEDGTSKYSYIDFENEQQRVAKKFINMFKETVLSINLSENIIVVKTILGSASSACVAIDKLNISGIMGSVAGDDCLIIISSSKEVAPQIVHELKAILQN